MHKRVASENNRLPLLLLTFSSHRSVFISVHGFTVSSLNDCACYGDNFFLLIQSTGECLLLMSPVDPFRDAEASSSIQEKVFMLVFPSSPEKKSGVGRFYSGVECLLSKSTTLGLVPAWLEIGEGLNDE